MPARRSASAWFRRATGPAGTVLLALGTAVTVALATVAFLGPRTGTVQVATVLSGSMAPAMSAGDLVIATPKPLNEIAVGDVLVFNAPIADRRLVTHRVIEVVEQGTRPVVRTKGDANSAPDPWLAQLERGPAWEVRAVVPEAGRVLAWLRTPLVRAVLLWIVPVALAVLWLRGIWRSNEGESP